MNSTITEKVRRVKIATWSNLDDRQPAYALVANVDLVVIRYDDRVSVLYGRCQHRGALLADGSIVGDDIICGVHNWDYQYRTGISSYAPGEILHKFRAWVDEEADAVCVDEVEVGNWERENPQRYRRDAYLGLYEDVHGGPEEPHNKYIRTLAHDGLTGHHGPVSAMGVPLVELPRWDDIQFVTAQLAKRPLMDDAPVGTELIVGPKAKKPLRLSMPIFVSDMSFGALSEEAKVALAMGAEMAGTGIASGEGGMLPEEKAVNSRYFYELASGRFGWSLDKVRDVQAFHFKAGQGAKTGTGGHLPGAKVTGKIAQVRGLEPGQDAVSPATFPSLVTVEDYRRLAEQVRQVSGGIPIGFKLSAQHIEDDLDFVLEVGVDYIILDGRGGGTGAAPDVFKNNISVPTMAALARARRHLDRQGFGRDVTLIITGGLRTESDFAKALALGADGVGIANSAMQAIGCLGMRACHTNNCPVGIATQREDLRARLITRQSARHLKTFLEASVHLMQVLARACGHSHLNHFRLEDLTTWNRDMAYLTGVRYGGVAPVGDGQPD
jgi:glutamate synthase domain-containing protein 2